MITFDVFLMGMILVSTFTGIVTEAVKQVLAARSIECKANILSGIVSAFLSAAIGVGYTILTNSTFTPQIIVCIVALVFLSWLCAMVGYDKVIQVIKQFNTTGKG